MTTGKALHIAADAVVSISREGGVAFFPGLGKPRKIMLADCDDGMRRRALAALTSAAVRAVPSAGRGDQRYFRVEILNVAASATQTLLIPEQEATEALVKLWEAAGD